MRRLTRALRIAAQHRVIAPKVKHENLLLKQAFVRRRDGHHGHIVNKLSLYAGKKGDSLVWRRDENAGFHKRYYSGRFNYHSVFVHGCDGERTTPISTCAQ